MTRNFDDERTQKVMAFFCEILKENSCNIISITEKQVMWEFTSGNIQFKKLINRDIDSYKDLTQKELKSVESLQRKMGLRWRKKALKRYMMNMSKASEEEKLALIESIKNELKDKENSDLKNLVGKV